MFTLVERLCYLSIKRYEVYLTLWCIDRMCFNFFSTFMFQPTQFYMQIFRENFHCFCLGLSSASHHTSSSNIPEKKTLKNSLVNKLDALFDIIFVLKAPNYAYHFIASPLRKTLVIILFFTFLGQLVTALSKRFSAAYIEMLCLSVPFLTKILSLIFCSLKFWKSMHSQGWENQL